MIKGSSRWPMVLGKRWLQKRSTGVFASSPGSQHDFAQIAVQHSNGTGAWVDNAQSYFNVWLKWLMGRSSGWWADRRDEVVIQKGLNYPRFPFGPRRGTRPRTSRFSQLAWQGSSCTAHGASESGEAHSSQSPFEKCGPGTISEITLAILNRLVQYVLTNSKYTKITLRTRSMRRLISQTTCNFTQAWSQNKSQHGLKTST